MYIPNKSPPPPQIQQQQRDTQSHTEIQLLQQTNDELSKLVKQQTEQYNTLMNEMRDMMKQYREMMSLVTTLLKQQAHASGIHITTNDDVSGHVQSSQR